MFAFARLFVIGMIVLTVIYFSVSLYSRAARRGKLAAAWDAGDRNGDWQADERDQQGPFPDRETYISIGMKVYDEGLRKKLILGVYVVPIVLVALTIYLTNFH